MCDEYCTYSHISVVCWSSTNSLLLFFSALGKTMLPSLPCSQCGPLLEFWIEWEPKDCLQAQVFFQEDVSPLCSLLSAPGYDRTAHRIETMTAGSWMEGDWSSGSLCGGKLPASQKPLPGLSWEREIGTFYGFISYSSLYYINNVF